MKKIILTVLVSFLSLSAFAERYVMVTHGEGKDPFWPVVQKGGEDAARHVGADFEYIFNPSGDMGDMAKSIAAAAATQPDGMVVSLPDPEALGQAIKDAVAAGIPVVTMNSGLESSASLGALMHVGQPEFLAGQSAGARAKAEGATKALCMIQEAYNTALTDRCGGYAEAIPTTLVDSSNDPATIPTRAAAGLQANPDVDAVLSVGPHVCVGVQQAIDELGMSVHHSCFDLSPHTNTPTHPCRTIVALVYNVLKTMMQMNCKLFDELTSSYKSDKQRWASLLLPVTTGCAQTTVM